MILRFPRTLSLLEVLSDKRPWPIGCLGLRGAGVKSQRRSRACAVTRVVQKKELIREVLLRRQFGGFALLATARRPNLHGTRVTAGLRKNLALIVIPLSGNTLIQTSL